jgi:hypothetical protein
MARLLIPTRLSFVLLCGAAATACASSHGSGDAGVDAQTDSTACSTATPKGKICVTDCLMVETVGAPQPFPCDIFCDLPPKDVVGEATLCFLPDGGADPQDCARTILPDAGTEVLC